MTEAPHKLILTFGFPHPDQYDVEDAAIAIADYLDALDACYVLMGGPGLEWEAVGDIL